MRDYRPDSADLLRTVDDYLADLLPRLDSGDRYQALVCRHLLGMVRRELDGGPLADVDEAALSHAIRTGVRDTRWDETLEEVLARTVERVRRVKPDHLSPEHRP